MESGSKNDLPDYSTWRKIRQIENQVYNIEMTPPLMNLQSQADFEQPEKDFSFGENQGNIC